MSGSLAAALPVGVVLVLGALLLPLVPQRMRLVYLPALPVLSLLHLLSLPDDAGISVGLFGLTLELMRVDRLSLIFGYLFHLAALIAVIYALSVKETAQHVAALIYAGAAIGAVFAGDLVTLFVWWELTAAASVFLIWARRTERAYRAGLRYLVIQVSSGVILLAGAALWFAEHGSVAFGALDLDSLAGQLIFLAFGIKAAFPLLHNWLQDAYPEATVTGTVFLSAFTTKLAVYALARGYAGTEILIWIGAIMAVFPMFYALLENDLRRLLAYSLNIQLGFMIVGVGIGTPLALDGAAAHAVSHTLYKLLLFMAIGAVLLRTGTAKATGLGGLARSMPWTAAFCLIGAASIAAVPLFSGHVSKALIMTATANGDYALPWFMLMFASAGVLLYVSVRVPWLAFYGRDAGHRVAEAPLSMRAAMALAAIVTISIGVYPGLLLPLLPFATDYDAYTVSHIVSQLQLLLFAALALGVLVRLGLYPATRRAINIDFDWTYRRALPALVAFVAGTGGAAWNGALSAAMRLVRTLLAQLSYHHGAQGILARTWPTGSMTLWVTVILAISLIVYYLG
jgi:multicomponent Na+:H+ antiporter subunit D